MGYCPSEVEDYAAKIMLRSDGTVESAKTKKIASGVNGGPTLGDFDLFGYSVASLGDLDGDAHKRRTASLFDPRRTSSIRPSASRNRLPNFIARDSKQIGR